MALAVPLEQPVRPPRRRWAQLAVGILAMIAIANMQYGWTLFVEPLQNRFGWKADAIQWAFTLFVLAETWLVPLEAYCVDRWGPRPMVALGAVLIAAAWLLNARAASLPEFYAAGVIGGAGAGIVYGTAIGSSLKWFPDCRGLAAGLTAAAFGAGSALTVLPIKNMIDHQGYAAAFQWFGLGQGALVLVAACFMRAPREGELPPVKLKVAQSPRDTAPVRMLATPLFWLMYAMFTMTSLGGLMAIAQIAPMAKDFRVADTPVTFFGVTMAALPFAMSLDRVLNGVTRPFFGWVSDHLGRERTMAIGFALEGVAILFLTQLAHHPVLFVLLTGLTFFAWGQIYSLFPALSGDLFGRKFAATNYGLLYTAKGTAALLVPLGSLLQERTGSWTPIFGLAAAFDLLAAVLALVALRPLCARWLRREG